MLTATLFRDAWGAVVADHQGDPAFQSWWDETLDRPADVPYMLCVWLPPDPTAEVATSKDGTVIGVRAGFTAKIEVRDCVAPTRTREERDASHAKVAMYLHQLFAVFVDRYVRRSTAVNGQTVSLKIVQPMTSDSFHDEAPNGDVFVVARFSVVQEDTMNCASFNTAFP